MVHGSKFRVSDSGIAGSGLDVAGLGFSLQAKSKNSRVSSLGCRFSDFGCQVSGYMRGMLQVLPPSSPAVEQTRHIKVSQDHNQVLAFR